MRRGPYLPLRSKLLLAAVLVEVLMLSLLVANSLRLSREALAAQAELRVAALNVLFNAALAAPLAQRDYGTLNEILEESRAAGGVVYAVLTDRHGNRIAQTGERFAPAITPTHTVTNPAEGVDGIRHLSVAITLAGVEYGRLSYGLSTTFLDEAQHRLLSQSLAIAGLEVALSIVLLTLIGLWLTRHLRELTLASRAVSEGNYAAHVPVRSRDEVGELAQAFNRMIDAVVARMGELQRTGAELRRALADLTHSEAEQRRYAQTAEEEHARLIALLSAMNLGILFVAPDGRVVYHNPAFRRLWRVPEEVAITGMSVREVMQRADSQLARPDLFSRHVLAVLSTHESSDALEIQLRDGRTVTQLAYPVHDADGRHIGQLWIYEDVTHERQTAAQLAYLAEHDPLTGLYNRHHFRQELERMLADAERNASQCALIFFDLDEFKVINDSFGHSVGDQLLTRVAGELKALVRRNETLARLGGDEFALLVPHAREEEVIQVAERIVRAIGAIPFRFEGQGLRLTSSLGIALYPQHGTDADSLIAHADAAMYQAKQAGKNTWRVYRADRDAMAGLVHHLAWNDRIDRALERGLLRLHFQGVYRAADGSLAHLEALLRMVDEERPEELILPGRFIPIAEKSGRILALDRWVIGEAIRTLALHPNMPVLAVNVSGRSLDDAALPQYIADRLREYGVAAHRLIVELTETSAVSDMTDAQRFIEALRAMGCSVCLDDFGSGFSSFAYLKHLPVDTVKIDGMFIRNLPDDRDDQIFVKAITDVARGMGRVTVAEFVEDARCLKLLQSFGVDLVQGYHLDTPRADHPGLGGMGVSETPA